MLGPRIGLAAAVLIVASAASAGQATARPHVLARWNVTISGSVTHNWTLTDSTPCAPSGSGSVSVRFASAHSQHIAIADNGFGLGDVSWNGVFNNINGTITATDNRTRNPPAFAQECDSSAPVPDIRACGTKQFRNVALMIESPLTSARRHGYALEGGGFPTPALNAPEDVHDCELDGFRAFSYIFEGIPKTQSLELPGYPSLAELRSRHGTIVVSASQSHRFIASALTVRQARLVFTRTR
jgi:hypothetical protein